MEQIDDRDESPSERLDRHWTEILQELRVTQTGTQVLTGFLLTVPFQQRFTELTEGQRVGYLVLVVLSAVTTGLMVAPVSLHRRLFRHHARATLVRVADLTMRAGLVLFALVVGGVVMLVFDVVAGRMPAVVATLGMLAFLGVAWFAVPALVGRRVAGAQR